MELHIRWTGMAISDSRRALAIAPALADSRLPSNRAADTLHFKRYEVGTIVLNSVDIVGTLEPANYTAAVARMCPARANL